MKPQAFRLSSGGIVDRDRPLEFTFNGKIYQGYSGDSLASALLANGVRLVGRSFKYHRPRGIFSAGPEEPSALVQVGKGDATVPNLRATEVPLVEGLEASSQNCWPSVRYDLGAVNNVFSRLFPAGFYYKTFMWPASLWMTYEHYIRRIAGMGEAPRGPDPDHYDRHYGHCDVLVVGGGPAGLVAAQSAARSGARVILAEQGSEFGGALLGAKAQIDGRDALHWVSGIESALAQQPEVTLLKHASVFGYFDQNLLGIVEQSDPQSCATNSYLPRERVHYIRAKRVVLATGSIERPLVFADNDRPGVMLAGAARTYVNRYGVQPGKRALVFTNNDSAYGAALDLAHGGIEVAAVVDLRTEVAPSCREALDAAGIELLTGHAVAATHGSNTVWGAEVMALDEAGQNCLWPSRVIKCDLVACSGGWTPSVHLFSQSQGRLRYEDAIAAFVPGQSKQAEVSAGAAMGDFTLAGCLASGFRAGRDAVQAAGFDAPEIQLPNSHDPDDRSDGRSLRALWQLPGKPGKHPKRFVDQQNDVTAADVALAHREGYVSVEHLKRYTTLGMGTDQGKTSNINGLGIMSDIQDASPQDVGTTTFRAPYTPVTMGAIAGREIGDHFAPVRRTPLHDWHEEAGAVFVEAGLWLRPRYYPRAGETLETASAREARHVREKAGVCDVSTLGKIDIQGTDAAEFLNRVYINGFAKLPVGRARYGVMLRDDGIAYDDGTTTRLAENHYLMTTTTANAVPVMAQLEYYLQVVWPELDVHIASVTDLWATVAIAGPEARRVLQAMEGNIDFSNEALPFMGYVRGQVAGMEAHVFRISFSGELAYEIAVPADYGQALWNALLDAGRPYDTIPYGMEALGLLRIEKGHVVIGAEIDGRTTAGDLGFGGMLSTKKPFVGSRSLRRPALDREDRQQLVGLVSVDGRTAIPAGAQLVADPDVPPPVPMQGHVTSTCQSPNLERPVALAMVERGRERLGDELYACAPVQGATVKVRLCSAHFVDPEGVRLRA